MRDSNSRPLVPETNALSTWANRPLIYLYLILWVRSRVKGLVSFKSVYSMVYVVRERVHTYLYPVMPIFSRRYLLASREVVKYVGFRWTRLQLPRLPRCKLHIFDHCKSRWNFFWDIAFQKQPWPPLGCERLLTMFHARTFERYQRFIIGNVEKSDLFES